MNPDIAAEAVDAAFEELGIPGCTYTPPSGAVVSGIALMLMRPDDEASLGDARVVVGTVRIDVRTSEVAAPAKGGTFTISTAADAPASLSGKAWRVIAKPQHKDAAQLIWQCEAQAV
jgi:hypothetical protein